MRKREPVYTAAGDLSRPDLERFLNGWILEGDSREFTPRTMEERRRFARQLLWFMDHRAFPVFGTHEIRACLAYVAKGHEEPGGRWGNPRLNQPAKPRTVEWWFDQLQALCNWIVEEADLDFSPMRKVKPPVSNADQIQPFTNEQFEAIRAAARRSLHPRRNEAILLFMLDTGCRASELCGLTLDRLDLQSRASRIVGKGRKARTLHYGRETAKALWSYLQEDERDPEDYVFLADRGQGTGGPLTRNGLYQLIRRLGQAAALRGVRPSPHTLRHTFAVSFLRNGGNEFSLQQALGHSSLTMTRRYVLFVEADVAVQHRQFGPVDNLRKRKR